MANPWDNDVIIKPTTTPSTGEGNPWDKDVVVKPANSPSMITPSSGGNPARAKRQQIRRDTGVTVPSVQHEQELRDKAGEEDNSVLGWPARQVYEGLNQVASGVGELRKPYNLPTGIPNIIAGGVVPAAMFMDKPRIKGASDIARGLMQYTAPFTLPAAIATVPLKTAVGLGAGAVSGALSQGASNTLQLPPEIGEVAGTIGAIAGGGWAAGKVPGKFSEVPGKVADWANSKVMPDHIQAGVQALKPSNRQLDFATTYARSKPLVEQASDRTGSPVVDVDSYIENTKAAKKATWRKIQDILGPKADYEVPGVSVGRAARAAEIATTPLEKSVGVDPKAPTQWDAWDRSVTLSQLETELQKSNAAISDFESQFPSGKTVDLKSNPRIAAEVAKNGAIRDLLYGELDKPGDPSNIRELKKDYGSLIEAQSTAERRKIIADRQAPNSLGEQIGTMHGVARATRGIIRTMGGVATGNPSQMLGGIADIGSGAAEPKVAAWLKDQNTTNTLLRKSFEQRVSPVESQPPPLMDVRDPLGMGMHPATKLQNPFDTGRKPSFLEQLGGAPPDPLGLRGNARGTDTYNSLDPYHKGAFMAPRPPLQLPPAPFERQMVDSTRQTAPTMPGVSGRLDNIDDIGNAYRKMAGGPLQLPPPVAGQPPINLTGAIGGQQPTGPGSPGMGAQIRTNPPYTKNAPVLPPEGRIAQVPPDPTRIYNDATGPTPLTDENVAMGKAGQISLPGPIRVNNLPVTNSRGQIKLPSGQFGSKAAPYSARESASSMESTLKAPESQLSPDQALLARRQNLLTKHWDQVEELSGKLGMSFEKLKPEQQDYILGLVSKMGLK